MDPVGHADRAFQRLNSASQAPIAVAVSGGGDSMAALMLTASWARRHGRRVIALYVDHQIQPQSAAWAEFVEEAAHPLGAGFQALVWSGPKPDRGLPAAARLARHRLLARAARETGAVALVTGHTADDQRENALMGLGAMTEWSPSPVWPEGRGVFLLRPLLSAARSDIRGWLEASGQAWIDDPANDDLRHPRSHIRHASPLLPWREKLTAEGGRMRGTHDISAAGSDSAFAETRCVPLIRRFAPPSPARGEGISFEGEAISIARSAATPQLVAAAATCAGGSERLAVRASVHALVERLNSADRFTSTLAGARIQVGDEVLFTREAGEFGRRPPRTHVDGETIVWDGRYELPCGAEVVPVAGLASKLPPHDQAALASLAAPVRPALPARLGLDGSAILADARWLVPGRLLAAIGVISSEREACDAIPVADRASNPYLGPVLSRGELHEPA